MREAATRLQIENRKQTPPCSVSFLSFFLPSDVIDIVRDQLTGSDYKIEEDPCHYVSQRTGRGPLDENWTQHPPNDVIMCAYKLIKVSEYK